MGPVDNPARFDNTEVQVGPALFSNGGVSGTRNNPEAYRTGCFVWITLSSSTVDVDSFPNKVQFFARDVNLAGNALEVGGMFKVEFHNGRPPLMVGVPEFFKQFRFNNVKRITVLSNGPALGVTNIDDFSVTYKRPPGQNRGRGRGRGR